MTKEWLVAAPIKPELIDQSLGLNPLLWQLLFNRGLTDVREIKAFFANDWTLSSHEPLSFQQMERAVAAVVAEIKAGRPIAICGDYDADGVTATAVLQEVLTTLKAEVKVWIPSRLQDGYGLNRKIIEEIKNAGCALLITVDNGIRSKEEVAHAKSLGLQVIVTDHHAAPDDSADWPDCLIINPMLPGETYPFKYLAGVGVAFKLANALVAASNLTPAVKEKIIKRVLDLVAVGTVADCVNVLGENRLLIKEGLRELNARRRLGLSELIKISQLSGEINEWNISWQLAPRLNVAGRLDHANTAYELLITGNSEEAAALARRLNEKNIERQEETARVLAECRAELEAGEMSDKILLASEPVLRGLTGGKPWPEGVIGLVAGRLGERYGRPALVICASGNKIKGSGRSIEDYDIVALLGKVSQYLERFGGHKAACGFTVKAGQLAVFMSAVQKIAQAELAAADLKPKLKIDAELALDDINERLVEEINRCAPFGQGNNQPLFVSFNLIIRDKVTMGLENQHVKFRFGNFWAVAFGEAAKWQTLNLGERVDVVYQLEINRYNGQTNVQLRVVDIRPSLS